MKHDVLNSCQQSRQNLVFQCGVYLIRFLQPPVRLLLLPQVFICGTDVKQQRCVIGMKFQPRFPFVDGLLKPLLQGIHHAEVAPGVQKLGIEGNGRSVDLFGLRQFVAQKVNKAKIRQRPGVFRTNVEGAVVIGVRGVVIAHPKISQAPAAVRNKGKRTGFDDIGVEPDGKAHPGGICHHARFLINGHILDLPGKPVCHFVNQRGIGMAPGIFGPDNAYGGILGMAGGGKQGDQDDGGQAAGYIPAFVKGRRKIYHSDN